MTGGHGNGLRTPLKRVRGLGSAKEGVAHWWQTRLTSAALVPLTLWFVYAVLHTRGLEWIRVLAWAARPVNAILLILLTVIMFLHAASGIQAVLEDYVHNEGRKLTFIYVVKAICLVLGLACALSILMIALGQV